jgi:hypothetical protein
MDIGDVMHNESSMSHSMGTKFQKHGIEEANAKMVYCVLLCRSWATGM